MKPLFRSLTMALVFAPLLVDTAGAATCTAEDFAAVFDTSGGNLRAFSLEVQPKLQDRMRHYRDAKKISEPNYEDIALDAIQDSKLAALDEKSSTLLESVHANGRIAEGAAPDCAKLDEIKSQARELLDVMRQKSDYMLARLDAKILEAGGMPVASKDGAVKENAAKDFASKDVITKPVPAAPALEKPAASKVEPAKAEAEKRPTPQAWTANTKPTDAYVAPPVTVAQDAAPQPTTPGSDGYSIDEIREATRGFFGTVSTNLASVIEYAFKTTGRPTAYVLGTEGGGAFLAGLRFGEGTLFMRNQAGTRPVFWHGPSIGTDFGASGSRTMFLIYRMQQPDALFRSYAGVDGSAYFVGGVGITFLKGGDVLMAPIRSGLGLRVGANIGYLRFSDKQTWNPF